MSPIHFEEPEFRPSPLSPVRATREAKPEEVQRAFVYAQVPAIIVLGANIFWYLMYWLPELRLSPYWSIVTDQVGVLVSTEIFTRGKSLSPYITAPTWAATALVIAAALHGFAATRALPWRAFILWITALTICITSLPIILSHLEDPQPVATGLLLLLVVAGAAVTTAVRSLSLPPDVVQATGWGPASWFGLTALTVALPLAIGRDWYGSALRDAALRFSGTMSDTRWAALSDPTSTALLWLAGCAVLMAVCAVFVLLPPWRGRRLAAAVVALVLALGPGIAVLGPIATDAAEKHANELVAGP